MQAAGLIGAFVAEVTGPADIALVNKPEPRLRYSLALGEAGHHRL